jgi:nucleotide-binding universal stress UspA family protein
MHVILAIDDSPHSKEALETTIKQRWPENTEFRVLNVANGQHKYSVELCKNVRQKLITAMPDAIVHYEVRDGSVADEIINSAVEWNADKIIIGAHSKDICPHNLLGSVSRDVVTHAPCSVEIVRVKTKI